MTGKLESEDRDTMQETRSSIGRKLIAMVDDMNRMNTYKHCRHKVFRSWNAAAFAKRLMKLKPRKRALTIRLVAHELSEEEIKELREMVES